MDPTMGPEGDQSQQIQAKPSPSSSRKKSLSFKKKIAFIALTFLLFGTVAILSLEVALRLYYGELLSAKFLGFKAAQDAPFSLYDPLLGYVIRPRPLWNMGLGRR